jgi:pimeloyl-ACP methyl ester carboxylesterase
LPSVDVGGVSLYYVEGGAAVKVPGARHFPHIENPEFFNGRVLTFLEGAT